MDTWMLHHDLRIMKGCDVIMSLRTPFSFTDHPAAIGHRSLPCFLNENSDFNFGK